MNNVGGMGGEGMTIHPGGFPPSNEDLLEQLTNQVKSTPPPSTRYPSTSSGEKQWNVTRDILPQQSTNAVKNAIGPLASSKKPVVSLAMLFYQQFPQQ